MKFQFIVIVLAALGFGACIAGPTPHPGHQDNADPNIAGYSDTMMGTSGDVAEGQETNPPGADASDDSDEPGDATNEDSTQENEDSIQDDSVPSDLLSVDAG